MPGNRYRSSQRSKQSKADASGSFGRRSVLKGALGVGGSSTLAGCFGGDGDAASATASPTATNSPTATDPRESATASPTATVQQGPDDNVVVVTPEDDINAALGEVGTTGYGNAGYGVVRLQAGESYEISETIVMPTGSKLECNGARIVPQEDIDVIDVSRYAYVEDPFIDCRPLDSFSSIGVKVSTREGAVQPNNPSIVENLTIYGTASFDDEVGSRTGTGIQFIDENEAGMWGIRASGVIQLIGTGIEFKAVGEDSWCNTCYFDGIVKVADTAIRTVSEPGDQPTHGHMINLTYGTGGGAEWLWDMQSGKQNNVKAAIWDPQRIKDETFWRIGERAKERNVVVDEFNNYDWSWVVDNKYGGAPNGAAGNTLFNYKVLPGLIREVQDLKDQVE